MTTHFFGDTAVLLGRSLRHITRRLDTIITTTFFNSRTANQRRSSSLATASRTRAGMLSGSSR
jgi:hypothetical protein